MLLKRNSLKLPIFAYILARSEFQQVRSALYGFAWRLIGLLGLEGQNFFGLRRLPIIRANFVDSSELISIYPEGLEVRQGLATLGRFNTNSKYPALKMRVFENTMVCENPRVSSAISNSKFLIPSVADIGPWKIDVGYPNIGGMKYIRNENLLVRVREDSRSIDSGIFAGTWSPHNWFHWIIDTLPSIYLTRHLPNALDDVPILLPQRLEKRSNWIEPLDLVRNGRPVEYCLGPHRYTSVAKLYWLDSPTSPGPIKVGASENASLRVHKEALLSYRDFILQHLTRSKSEFGDRIFLARQIGTMRPYNQDELIDVAATFGFRPVFLDQMGFAESVNAVRGARYIIGPHGAGWANLLFNDESPATLMWTWKDGPNRNWFTNIAEVVGASMVLEFTDSYHDKREGSRYSSSDRYHFPKHRFEKALRRLIALN